MATNLIEATGCLTTGCSLQALPLIREVRAWLWRHSNTAGADVMGHRY